MPNNKRLIVLSSPSGGGKTTVARFLMQKYPSIRFSISATTRAKRPNENDGIDYYFLSKEEFESSIKENDFVEYEQIFDNYYGTLKSEVEKAFGNNELLIFDIDVKGAFSIRQHYPKDALLIFLAPPNLDVLEERLRGRSTESEAQIQIRLARAKMELDTAEEFDFVVVNNVLDDTIKEVERIVSENCFSDKL
ncbi:MAG: guanylate kinase [Ignavibacteriae bacterium HGW-Ignavibacteriae-1]|jgi:guanylate kinase|nr:MAG: guanylate kinase [Ignavibacteriae bacterium HGW-Ignavibacteriae-1]